MKLLNKIQQELRAPKSQNNSFGNYKYRTCEDILEAVKPLLGTGVLLISDDVVQLGDRYYVKATASLIDGDKRYEVTAYARETLSKTKFDEAQITGSASSYARKYALNGLFCIDDTKDADHEDNTSKSTVLPVKAKVEISKAVDVKKKQIKDLCDSIALNPISKEEYASYIKSQTGLEPSVKNLDEIIVRLTKIKSGEVNEY